MAALRFKVSFSAEIEGQTLSCVRLMEPPDEIFKEKEQERSDVCVCPCV